MKNSAIEMDRILAFLKNRHMKIHYMAFIFQMICILCFISAFSQKGNKNGN